MNTFFQTSINSETNEIRLFGKGDEIVQIFDYGSQTDSPTEDEKAFLKEIDLHCFEAFEINLSSKIAKEYQREICPLKNLNPGSNEWKTYSQLYPYTCKIFNSYLIADDPLFDSAREKNDC